MTQIGYISVYNCKFKFKVNEAQMVIKFPCQIYVQWKQQLKPNSVGTVQRVIVNNGIATFNETLYFQSQMIFDQQTLKFIKKQSTIYVNLISKNKPDSVKQIGRVIVDLGSICNGQSPFIELCSQQLAYSPMKGSTLTFSINLTEKHQINRSISQIDRECLNQYRSIHSKSNRQVNKIIISKKLQQENANLQNYQFDGINHQKSKQQQLPNNIQLDQPQNVNIKEKFIQDLILGKQSLITINKQQEQKSDRNVEQIVEVFEIQDVKQILKKSQIQQIRSQQKIALQQNDNNNKQKQDYQQSSKVELKNLEQQAIVKNDKQIKNTQKQIVNRETQQNNKQCLTHEEKFNEIEITKNQKNVNLQENKQILQPELALPYSITIKLYQQVPTIKQQLCQNIQISYYQQQITQMQQKINLLTKQNQILNKKLKDYNKNIDEQINKKTKETQQKESKLNQIISSLQISIKEKLQQIDNLRNQLQYIQQILTDYDNKVDQNMNLKFQLSQVKTMLQEQKILLQKFKQENFFLNNQIPLNLLANNEKLKNQTVEAKQSLFISYKYSQLSQQQQNQSFTLNKDVIQNLQNTIISLNQKIALIDEEKKLAQEVFRDKNKQAEEKNKDIKQLKNQINILIADLSQKKNQNSQVKKQLDSVKSLYQQIIKANLTLEKQKLVLVEELKNKQYEILLLKNDFQMIKLKLQQKIGQLQSYLDREVKFVEKEKKMKQNIDILEEQSKKIFRLVQGKEQIQEMQIRKIQEQSIQIQKLIDRNYQLENLHSVDKDSQKQQLKEAIITQLNQEKQLNNNLKQQIQYIRKMLEEAINNGKCNNNIDSIQQPKIHAEKLNELNYELINSKANLQTLLADSQSKIVSLSARIGFIQNQKAELQKKISMQQKNIKILQQQNQKIKQKYNFQSTILSQNSSIYNQNKQMSILKSLISQKQNQIDIMKQQIRQRDQNISKVVQIEDLLNKKEREILRLEEEIYSIHTNNNKKCQDIDGLREQNSNLKQKIVQLQNTIMGQQIQILNLKEKKSNIVNIQETKNIFQKQSQVLVNQQYQNESLKIQSLYQTIQKLSKQLDQLKYALAVQQQKNNDLKNQNNTIRQQHKKRIEQLNQKYQQFQKVTKIYKQQSQIIIRDDQIISSKLNMQHSSQINLKTVVEEIKNLLVFRKNRLEQAVIQRSSGNKLLFESKIKQVIDNYGFIIQKTKLLSIELNKLKLNIIKTLKNYQEKSLMLSNIKLCEKIISEVIQISETVPNIHIIPQIYDI